VKSLGFVIFLLITLWSAPTLPADIIHIGGLNGADPYDTHPQRSVLLALSSGGARGLASIGILKAFEEKHISVAAIAGTSIGGIVGGLYACGYTADEIRDLVVNASFSNLLANSPNRNSMFLTRRLESERHLFSIRFNSFTPRIPIALSSAQALTSFLTSKTSCAAYKAGGDFSNLKVPFKTVATDLVTGETVILSSGSLADALRATMAFPLAFTGVLQNEKLLMDGGMLIPVPVDIVRQMSDSVHFVVAVDNSSRLLRRSELVTPVDIANQATSIMAADKLESQLKRADFVITPDLRTFNASDFDYGEALIALGYQAGLTAADNIIARLDEQFRDTMIFELADLSVTSPDPTLVGTVTKAHLSNRFTRTGLIKKLKEIVRRDRLFGIRVELVPAEMHLSAASVLAKSIMLSLTLEPQLHAERISFSFLGNQILSDSALSSQCQFHNSRIDPRSLQECLDNIISLYSTKGFDLAYIRNVSIDFETNQIDIDIDEGIIKRIDVSNNIRSKDWLVRSYFPLTIDEPFSSRSASNGIDAIYSTDLYDRVSLTLMPNDSGAVIDLSVLEKPAKQLRVGWRWDDEYQSEEFLELLDDNIFGAGIQALGHTGYAQDRQDYYSTLKVDRIFKTYLTAQAKVFHNRLLRPLYNTEQIFTGERKEIKWGGSFKIGQQIARFGMVTGGISFEEIRYLENGVNMQRFGQRSLHLESLVETFDRVPFPETGKRHIIAFQQSGKILGGDFLFTKFYSSLESYFPVNRRINYHPKVSIGVSSDALPPSEKFYIGGLYSLSGYSTYQLSGDKMILLNHELRVRLPIRLYAIARYDIGRVYSTSEVFRLKNFRQGFGASLAFDSPLGPFEFGYGVTNNDFDRFYFQAGFTF